MAAVSAEGTGDYIHYRLGVKYKNEKKFDEAIDEFRKVLAAYPDNYNAYLHMAEIRSLQKRPRLVIYNLKKALSYNPGWSKAQKMLASAFASDKQYQKAILELQQYQQTSDPAERDSIQGEIDKLIQKVRGNQVEAAGAPKVVSKADSTKQAATPAAKMKAVRSKVGSKTAAAGKKKARAPALAGDGAKSDLFDQAIDRYNKEDFDGAMKLFRQVLAKQPGFPGAYYYAGLIRNRKGESKKAKINFRKGIAYPELGFNAHFYLGKIYGNEKNFAEAIRHLFLYIGKTDYEPGKEEAKKLIEVYRQNGGQAVLAALAPGGETISTVQDTATALERYLTLEVRIDSLLSMVTVDTITNAGQQLLGGIRAFQAGRYDAAIGEFKKVLALHPTGTIAMHCLYNTGICYLKLRLLKDAENQFQQILDKYSNHSLGAQSLFLKGLTYQERTESATAEALYRKFIQKYRKHRWIGNVYEKLGDAYVDLETPTKAVDAYSQAFALGNKPVDKVAAAFKLGQTYQKIGNAPRAIEAFKSALETGEKKNVYLRVPDSYYRIADGYYKEKKYDKALKYYTGVTRKYPAFIETPWGLFQIGSIFKNQQKYQDAIDAFKNLMSKFPDDYWARQAQWKMEDTIWEFEYKTVLK